VTQELLEFSRGKTPLPFGDVAGDGDRGTADLAGQAIDLVPWKMLGAAINISN
jgi:hypothetical protein